MTELERFAEHKRLPIAFLRKNGVEEGEAGIRFTNGDARVRTRPLADSHKTFWESDYKRPMRVYGYNRVAGMAKVSKTALIVEGESDSLSAWFHKRPALGIPGASMYGKLVLEDIAPFDRVVIIREPGKAGEQFAVNGPKHLRGLAYPGAVVVADLPCKDLSDLHIMYANNAAEFERVLNAAIAAATPAAIPVVAEDTNLESEVLWPDERPLPILAPDALYGLAGDIVGAIETHTEADPAALLAHVLTAFGALVGPGPHVVAEGRAHPARLFVLIVGETSRARKGTARARVRHFFEVADKEMHDRILAGGLASGEGLIEHLSDKVTAGEDGEPVVIHVEKRALIHEEEFARTLTVAGRDGNTLGDIIRGLWDTGRAQVMTRKAPLKVDGGHVCMMADITEAELEAKMPELHVVNGLLNRYLILFARRSKMLSDLNAGKIPAPSSFRSQSDSARRWLPHATWANANSV